MHSRSSLSSCKKIRQGLGEASASWGASGQSSWKPFPPWTGLPSTSCPWCSSQVRASLGTQGFRFSPRTAPRGNCPVSVHLDSSLCFVFAGLCAEPVLTQPPSASASPGASVKLTCTLSSELSGYTIRWYQQQAGKAPRFVLYVQSSGSHSKGDGIPDRFSGSSSGAHRYLTISNLQSEDDADYYCATWYSSGNAHSDTGQQGSETQTPFLFCVTLSSSPNRTTDKAINRSGPGPQTSDPQAAPPQPQAAVQRMAQQGFSLTGRGGPGVSRACT